ncbi:MAG: hypothetical protein II033_03975 [Clostridia bacterium]|nr:hypothetical protein [Clostridia bacterium]
MKLVIELTKRHRTGRWIWAKDEGWDGGGKTTCTACGNSFADGSFFEVEDFNYCPTCGAYMQDRRNRE